MFSGARRRTAIVVMALVAALAIAACGSSSTTATTSTTASAGGAGARAAGGQFASLTATQKACLKKAGVTLPTGGATGGRPAGGTGTFTRPTGTPPAGGSAPSGASGAGGAPGAGAGFGGGTSAAGSKFAKAFKACGVTVKTGFGAAPTAAGASSGAKISATAIKEFEACVDKHGYTLTSSEVNTSGTGSVLSKSLETNQKFLAAAKDCEQYL